MFLQESIQLVLVLTRVLPFFINNEGRIAVHPIAERFHYSLERLDIDDFNQNFLAVFLGQLSDPIGKKKVILLQILRIFIEVLVIPLVLQLQTQLVCDAITVKSSSQKTRDQGNDFEGDRFHRFLLYDNLGHR